MRIMLFPYVFLSNLVLNSLPGIFYEDYHWYVYPMCKQLELFLWITAGASSIPYRYLFIKSLCAIWAMFSMVDSLGYLFYILMGKFYYPLYAVKVSFSFVLILFIAFRDYDRQNDVLDDHHFFIVGMRPKNLKDFFWSLIKDPVGGIGVYFENEFYHYRNGKLVVQNRKYLEKLSRKYRIEKVRPIDEERKQAFRSLIGSKYENWSWRYNCKTVLEPILGNRSKPW